MDTTNMTKLVMLTGVAYTNLKPSEVRQYLQGGAKTGTIQAFLEDGTEIILAVHAIEYIYNN